MRWLWGRASSLPSEAFRSFELFQLISAPTLDHECDGTCVHLRRLGFLRVMARWERCQDRVRVLGARSATGPIGVSEASATAIRPTNC